MTNINWLERDKGYSAATIDNLYLEYWNREALPADYQRQFDLQRAFVDSLPERRFIALTYVGLVRFKALSKESNAILAKSRAELTPHSIATAIVMPQKGFASAMLRGIVAGMSLLSPNASPSEVFSNIADASVWLAERDPKRESTSIERAATAFIATIGA
jgi:hypothetical protein